MKTVPSLLFWSLSRVAVRLFSSLGHIFQALLPLSEAANHLLLIRSTIDLSQCIPNVENSSESSMVMPLPAKSSALLLPEISLCPDTHVWYDTNLISVRHIIETYTTVVHNSLGVCYIIIQCFYGRFSIGKYDDFSLVNIFVHNNFHRSPNCRHFCLKDIAVIW